MQKLFKPLFAVKTKSGISVLTAVVVTLFFTWVVFDATKTEVVIAADGDVQTIKTHISTVGELLDDLGIDVGQYDALSHGENAKIVDGMKIEYDAANKVLLTIDGETEEYFTPASTVGEFFQQEGFTFSEHDKISHNNIEVVTEDMEITVTKAYEVTVNDGDKEKKVWTTGGTVKELLQRNNIPFTKSDKIKPGLKKDVKEDTKVTIIHVEKKQEEVTEDIPYQTEEKEDSTLEKGQTKVVSEGEEGELVKTIEVTYENGKEIDREVIAEDVKKESENKVIAIGTKEVEEVVTLSETKTTSNKSENREKQSESSGKSNDASSSGNEKVYTMEATAYGPDCVGCSGISATGMNLNVSPTPKVIAVDPSVIPLGSRVWVEGYGEAIAADTGGAIKGNRIDVLMQSEASASSWGRQTVTVKVLD